MLFMAVFTYQPEHRDEVIRRRAEKGPLVPNGVTVLGEWSYIGSGRVLRLIEVEDSAAAVGAEMAWTDIGDLEVLPVVEVDKIMPRITDKMMTAAAR
jgi:hypothetical protein